MADAKWRIRESYRLSEQAFALIRAGGNRLRNRGLLLANRGRLWHQSDLMLTVPGSVVAGISPSGATTPTPLSSFDTDRDRASQLQHAVQGKDRDGNFTGTTRIFATAQAITNHLLVTSDSRLDSQNAIAHCLA